MSFPCVAFSPSKISILRFLAAAEILEADLWQQYNEVALGNPAFQQALFSLDGDMPSYVNQNTRDEISRAYRVDWRGKSTLRGQK